MRRLRRIVGRLLVTAVLVGVLAVSVFPTRSYLNQRREIDAAHERVKLLNKQNKELAARVKKLHTDAEIERLAREQYNLVRPGEEAYALLPGPEDAPIPAAAPVKTPKPEPKGFWSRAWDTVTFWD